MNRVEAHQEAGARKWALARTWAVRHFVALLIGGAWMSSAGLREARAQLAITEVMSSGTLCPGRMPDFWELTNFGTNAIDLTGYRFWDKDAIMSWDNLTPLMLPSTNIEPGNSVVFVRSSNGVTAAEVMAAFRAWWGDAKLPVDLQIYPFPDLVGFNAGFKGDAVRLWDPNTNLVDAAYFGETELDKGITFISDPVTGEFGVPSQFGVCGAFRAASCPDIGSPGFAGCGRAPLSVTQQPVSQTNDAGSDATFHVQANGLPRPRYQWYFNGAPISGAAARGDNIPPVVSFAGCGLAWQLEPKATDLRIANVQPTNAGQYFVVISNGLERLTSAVVRLTVNTTPAPPRIECPPTEWLFPPCAGQRQTNLVLSPWQTAKFDVVVRAYPPPTFRWSWSADGTSFTDLPGATNRMLEIGFVQTNHIGTYRVRVQNSQGTNYACATLTVTPTPALRITEAMSIPCRSSAGDWWELTNIGDVPVNLAGYRWDDEPGNVGGGPTITNCVIIQPGESIIFLEAQDQTPESFIQWWGAENLPANLQFIVYSANGLYEQGDEITLWNQSAADNSELNQIDSVNFSAATQGASFWFEKEACLASEFGLVSVAGDCGALRATNGCEMGSPGWTRWTPPRLNEIKYGGSSVTLHWKAQPGSTNRIQFARQLTNPPSTTIWTNLGTYSFAGATGTATDNTIGKDGQRFYRVVQVAPAGCECRPDE